MQNAVEKLSDVLAAAVKPLVARVHAIVTHFEPHDDELLARWFLRTFGEELLPGVRKAIVQLVDSGLRVLRGKTGAEWFALGYPCLGTCGGPLDEHDLPQAERENASAATLAARMLHIEEYAPVKAMLAHAVRVDRTATASQFDVSAVVKAWHRSGVPIGKVCHMYDRMADAWFTVLSGKVRNPDWQKRPAFDQLTAEWIVNHLSPEGYDRSTKFATAFDAAEDVKLVGIRTLRPLLDYFIKEERRSIMCTAPGERLFELNGTVEALNQDGASDQDIRDIVFTSLQAKWDEQLRFMEGRDQLEALQKAGELYITGCRPWRVIQVFSDNPDINRSARSLDPHHDVFMQWGTDGHFVAWYNKDKFTMDQVIAGLREAEMRAAGRYRRLSWKTLTTEGTLPDVPQWYYNPANGQIMNGSRTNRDKPKTKLDANTVIMIFTRRMKLIGSASKSVHADAGFANTPRITT